jgi:DnaJ-class molecular chaperone
MIDKKTEEEETRKEIINKIKELDSVDNKFRSIALNHHLEKKKALDSEMEKEMKALTLKYEILSKPIYKDTSDIITGARGVN